MSYSPASILFDKYGSEITTVSGIDGVRLGVSVAGEVQVDSNSLSLLATEATTSGIAQTLSSLDIKDFATETTQQSLATEAKLEAVRLILESIEATDFAKDSSLSSLHVTLSGIDTSLGSLAVEDFATEATLSGIAATASSLDSRDFATETTLSNLEGKDFATESTQQTLATEATASGVAQTLTSINLKDFATETTLVSLEAKDFATEATLANLEAKDFATETTLSGLASTATNISNLDFATQATLATLATEAKLEAARVILANLDAKDFATQTTLASFLSAFNSRDLATQTTLAAFSSAFNARDLATQTTASGIAQTLTAIKDTSGVKKITDALPVGDNNLGRVKLTDGTNVVTVTPDAGTNRLNILGKVVVTGATAPPATTSAIITADNPLSVGNHDTSLVIPSGKTYYLQEIVAGNEDPTKGAVVTVLYNNGTEHVVARIYISGQTISTGYPDRSTARDGTVMVGNGVNTIVVRRTKYSGSDIAIDAVVRGYTL